MLVGKGCMDERAQRRNTCCSETLHFRTVISPNVLSSVHQLLLAVSWELTVVDDGEPLQSDKWQSIPVSLGNPCVGRLTCTPLTFTAVVVCKGNVCLKPRTGRKLKRTDVTGANKNKADGLQWVERAMFG